ncbi:hypothetical protein B7P43_G13505, partial [Cryptotermes secundus]
KMLILLKAYFISTYLASIVTLVHTSICSKSMFVQLLEEISQVDYKLLNKKEQTNRKRKCTAIRKVVTAILLIMCYQICIMFLFLKGKFEVYIIKTIECASLTCNVLTAVLFTNYVQIVTERHKHVNKVLETFITDVRCDGSNAGYCAFTQSASNRIATVPHVFSESLVTSNLIHRHRDIHSVRILYNQIFDIFSLVNNHFGLPVLAVTCWILTNVVLIVFHTLCYFEVTSLIGMCNCILCFLMKMILACQNAENEGDTSKILVQKLLLGENNGDKVVKELKMLSAQLKNMKIKYTAYGFFALNFPNLCSAIGLIVSYVIIVVQLQ